ncbi:LOW QUALITY PROTEIN: Doublecoronin [Drechslerella dactyloides]|uniref:Doublecoronin n=1 Tax=Drechslerella dactyloides TaxID=74499 RepID=A0AAD6NNJ7_DREDA|nr:LOW QUALITY PROTEIN: Doublecoronin [Drechslerella dactyloides]
MDRFNAEPEKWWNNFYKNNRENFFKDRKWLQQEFPILTTATAASSPPIRLLEVGCGAGNTLFPILAANKNPNFHIHGADFSKTSIDLIHSHELYTTHHPAHISASVWDLGNADGALPDGVEEGSIDVVILIFVFSALHPDQWAHAVRNVNKCLKTGGKVLFRDYGRGDLAQVRFKKGRFLEENFYVRGDGTRVYFFERGELGRIFDPDFGREARQDGEGPLENNEEEIASKTEETGIKAVLLGVDRRMLVNRARRIKMHRCWLQGLFVKGGGEEVQATLAEQRGPEPQWMRVAHTDVTDRPGQTTEDVQLVDTPRLEEQTTSVESLVFPLEEHPVSLLPYHLPTVFLQQHAHRDQGTLVHTPRTNGSPPLRRIVVCNTLEVESMYGCKVRLRLAGCAGGVGGAGSTASCSESAEEDEASVSVAAESLVEGDKEEAILQSFGDEVKMGSESRSDEMALGGADANILCASPRVNLISSSPPQYTIADSSISTERKGGRADEYVMNISSHLLHRSLAADVFPATPPATELSHIFTTFLYDDIDYDPDAQFRATDDLTGHSKGINCIAVDETAGRWHLAGSIFFNHVRTASKLRKTSLTDRMVSGGADGSLLIWDLEQEDPERNMSAASGIIRQNKSHHGVSSIRFNPHDASLFSTTSYSATLSLFSLDGTSSQPSAISTYPLDSHLYTHSISAVSATATIAVAGSSPHIRLIDPRTSSASQTLFGHVSSVLSIAWSPIYSSILASGGADGSIRIWDIRFGASCLGSLDASRLPQPANRAPGRAHEGGVNGLLWTPDGRKLISAGMDAKVRIWGMETGENTNVIFPPVVRNKLQAPFPMLITDDGETLWIGSEEQVLRFELDDGKMLKRVRIPKSEARDGMGRITGLAERKGLGELYTCHAMREGKGLPDKREGIARWRAEWLCEEEEEVVEKTAKQQVLEDIFEKMAKAPVRFT